MLGGFGNGREQADVGEGEASRRCPRGRSRPASRSCCGRGGSRSCGRPGARRRAARRSRPRKVTSLTRRAAGAQPVDESQQIERAERLRQEQIRARLLGLALDAVAVGAVSITIVASRVSGSSRRRRHASIPSSAGMSTSRKTSSGARARATLKRLEAVGGLVELELGHVFERGRDQLADERVVVDDEHTAAHRIRRPIVSKISSSIERKTSITPGRNGCRTATIISRASRSGEAGR